MHAYLRLRLTMDWTGLPLMFILLSLVAASVAQQSKAGDIIEISPDRLNQTLVRQLNQTSSRETIQLNTAWLTVMSLMRNDMVDVYWQHEQCIKCPLKRQFSVFPETNVSTLLQSSYFNHLEVVQLNDSEPIGLCSGSVFLKERGDYFLIIEQNDDDSVSCHLALFNQPENYDMVVLYAFAVLMGVGIIYGLIKCAYLSVYCQRTFFRRERSQEFDLTESNRNLELETTMSVSSVKTTSTRLGSDERSDDTKDSDESAAPPPPPKMERLRSLDAFRGLSLLMMVFVNYGGGGYWYFGHAIWNGLYITDLIFPWFVFIMGTSMSFGIRSLVKKRVNPVEGLWGIIWRSVKIFCAGIIYNSKWSNDLEALRLTGVLQRLAMVYLITAIVHYSGEGLLCCLNSQRQVTRWRFRLADLMPYFGEWLTMLVLLAVYCYFTYWFEVPGCPAGYVGPGGLHEDGEFSGCSGGAALYIDERVFTLNHIYQWPTIRNIYETDSAFDPEGMLGTLTAIFTCFLGLQAGKIIVCHKGHRERLVRFFIWAIICGGIGTLLCKASIEDGWIPINKNLWSISFALISAGTGFFILAVMYMIIDSWKLWGGQPFTYAGMNSIVLYMCHAIFQEYFPVSWKMPDMTLHWQLLLLHLWGTTFWGIVAYLMYKNKVFIAL